MILQVIDATTTEITAETAAIWGKITAAAQQEGFMIHASDGLIAATAMQHGCI